MLLSAVVVSIPRPPSSEFCPLEGVVRYSVLALAEQVGHQKTWWQRETQSPRAACQCQSQLDALSPLGVY